MILAKALSASPFGYARKPYNGTFLYYASNTEFILRNGNLADVKKPVELSATDWEPVKHEAS